MFGDQKMLIRRALTRLCYIVLFGCGELLLKVYKKWAENDMFVILFKKYQPKEILSLSQIASISFRRS
jgi:hypothetical protein